jgi:hypothetical protein
MDTPPPTTVATATIEAILDEMREDFHARIDALERDVRAFREVGLKRFEKLRETFLAAMVREIRDVATNTANTAPLNDKDTNRAVETSEVGIVAREKRKREVDIAPTSTKPKRSASVTKTKTKAKTTNDKENFLKDDLTEEERRLVVTGRGRRGEAVETPLGWAYFTENSETCLSVGAKIGIEPLTIYSMNRWNLKLKLDDCLKEGTRLWIQPREAWEFDYMTVDRTKALKALHARILTVLPDYIKKQEPFSEMKPKDFKMMTQSSTFYNEMMETLNNAEAKAKSEGDDSRLDDLALIRERFDEKWIEIGFLKPYDITEID